LREADSRKDYHIYEAWEDDEELEEEEEW